jgi:uncharacterized protein
MRTMTLPTIDTHEFTRRGDVADGSVPLASFERLASMLTSTEGALAWRLSGRSELGPDGSRSPFLRLGLDGTVRMRCVRCLEPVEVPLQVLRDYRLVATEAQAEREDADEDDVDLLVSSRRFDLAALVEDEAIMALPAAPRHDDCAAPAVRGPATQAGTGEPGDDGGEGARDAPRSPFAALAALRGGATGPGGAESGGGRAGEGGEARDADAPDDEGGPGGQARRRGG